MVSSKLRKIPSNKECKVGANLAIENAERLLRCATYLSEESEFGPAQSLLVLGIEEAIKAYFLYLKGLGISMRQKILNNILSHHGPRHDVGGLFYLMIGFLVWMLNSIMAGVRAAEGKNQHEALEIRNRTYQQMIEELHISAKKKDTEFNRLVLPIIDLWKNMDKKKISGFYVDIRNGAWSSPKSVMKGDYLQVLRVAQNVIQNCKSFFHYVETLPSKERAKMVREFKQQMTEVSKGRHRK